MERGTARRCAALLGVARNRPGRRKVVSGRARFGKDRGAAIKTRTLYLYEQHNMHGSEGNEGKGLQPK